MSDSKKLPDVISEESQELNVESVIIDNKMTLQNVIESLYGQNEIILDKYSIFEFNHIKDLDLSNRRLTDLPIELSDLKYLTYLNLLNNDFIDIPKCLLEGMKSIEILDVSNNKIKHIRKQPACVAKLKILKLQLNQLEESPEWICSNSIRELYLGGNGLLFSNEKFSVNKTQDNPDNNNDSSYSIFSPSLEVIHFGLNESSQWDNTVEIFPFHDILECTELKHLNLENVRLSDIDSRICQFQNLITVNLSKNVLMWLPDEFCNLINLKELILSYNNIMFLPENFGNLRSLRKLHLNDNNLESLPASLKLLHNLDELDLYSNLLTTMLDIANHVSAVDVARNYFDEPCDDVYVDRKQNLRQKYDMLDRRSGNNEFDNYRRFSNLGEDEDTPEADFFPVHDCNSTVNDEDENWDTDDYWEPPPIIKCYPSASNPSKQELPSNPQTDEYCLNNPKYVDDQFNEN